MSDSVQPYGLQPARLLCPWDSQATVFFNKTPQIKYLTGKVQWEGVLSSSELSQKVHSLWDYFYSPSIPTVIPCKKVAVMERQAMKAGKEQWQLVNINKYSHSNLGNLLICGVHTYVDMWCAYVCCTHMSVGSCVHVFNSHLPVLEHFFLFLCNIVGSH